MARGPVGTRARAAWDVFFRFSGRWRREKLWFGLAALAALVIAPRLFWPERADDLSPGQFAAFLCLCAVAFMSAAAMFARRWHDLGMSGWTTVHCLVPTFGNLGKFADALVTPGDAEPNDYGLPDSPPPRTFSRPHGRLWLRWLLFSFQGRIGRRDFWIGVGLIAVVDALQLWSGFALLDHHRALEAAGAVVPQWGLVTNLMRVTLLGLGLSLLPALAVAAKRWHDLGRSGLWSLMALFPIFGGIKLFLDCGLLPGDTGQNRFGASPFPPRADHVARLAPLLSPAGLTWLFFDGKGRISRKPFWIGQLALFILALATLTVYLESSRAVARTMGADGDHTANWSDYALTLSLVAVAVITFWSWFAVMAKRWHDADRSGWETAIAIIPAIGIVAAVVGAGMLRGTDGPNRYGLPPDG